MEALTGFLGLISATVQLSAEIVSLLNRSKDHMSEDDQRKSEQNDQMSEDDQRKSEQNDN